MASLRQELERLRQQLAHTTSSKLGKPADAPMEKAPALLERPDSPSSNNQTSFPDIDKLKKRITMQQNIIRDKNKERHLLLLQLAAIRTRLEAFETKAPKGTSIEDEDGSQEDLRLCITDEAFAATTARLPEFSKEFTVSFSSLPHHVSAAALEMFGRLTSGKPSAFQGSLRLKACREIWRQRIGIHYRLLFSLNPRSIKALGIIHRNELERWIKNQAT